MSTAIILTHAAHEGPGRLAPLLAARGLRLDERALHDGAPVPARVGAGDLLVVMGGSMGVNDRDSPAYRFLRAELALLERCIADDTPVMGVCLGAQLVAAAAGARVFALPRPEVGWSEVEFFGDLARASAPMLHWHGDSFDLPRGAQLFASTPVCAHQAFRLGRRQVGLQFHAEVTAEQVEHFIVEDEAFAARAGATPVQLRRDTRTHFEAFARASDALLARLLDDLLG